MAGLPPGLSWAAEVYAGPVPIGANPVGKNCAVGGVINHMGSLMAPPIATPRPRVTFRWTQRLLWQLYGLRPGTVLNAHSPASPPLSSASIAAELYQRANALRAAAYDPASGRLDYAGLAGSPRFAEYRAYTQRLPSFDPADLTTPAERLAFWINLYNALVIDAVIAFGVSGSVQHSRGFFWRAAYTVGGQRYALHDIEHGLLRANAPHPAIPGPHFAQNDPRRRFSLDRLDPRVHFALVCGARACPPIAFYTAEAIDRQLDQAARTFINGGGVTLMPQPKEIWLSQIFQWYASDFGAAPLGLGSRRPLLTFTLPYLNGAVAPSVVHTSLQSSRWTVRFKPYDWQLNDEAAVVR